MAFWSIRGLISLVSCDRVELSGSRQVVEGTQSTGVCLLQLPEHSSSDADFGQCFRQILQWSLTIYHYSTMVAYRAAGLRHSFIPINFFCALHPVQSILRVDPIRHHNGKLHGVRHANLRQPLLRKTHKHPVAISYGRYKLYT